jgi:phasin family protein
MTKDLKQNNTPLANPANTNSNAPSLAKPAPVALSAPKAAAPVAPSSPKSVLEPIARVAQAEKKQAEKKKAAPAVRKAAVAVKKATKATQKITQSAAAVSQKAVQEASRQSNNFQQTSFYNMEKFMTLNAPQFDQFAKDAAEIQKQSIETLNKSFGIFQKGMESFFKSYTEIAQNAAEKNSEYLKKALGSKTVSEWTATVNEATQSSTQDMIANTKKLTEKAVKVATETFEPINAQVTDAVKKASKKAA